MDIDRERKREIKGDRGKEGGRERERERILQIITLHRPDTERERGSQEKAPSNCRQTEFGPKKKRLLQPSRRAASANDFGVFAIALSICDFDGR